MTLFGCRSILCCTGKVTDDFMWGFMCGFFFSLSLVLSTLSPRCPLPLLNNKKKPLRAVIHCKQVFSLLFEGNKEALWVFCLYNQHIGAPPHSPTHLPLTLLDHLLTAPLPGFTRCAAFLTMAPVLGCERTHACRFL